MKRALVLALAMLFVCSAANAGFPYVGLYAGILDPDTGIEGPGGADRSQCGVFVAAPFTEINMWIWWYNPDLGLNSVEFKIVYPPSTSVGQEGVTPNPLIVAEIGNLPNGIASTCGELQCQHDWFWSHQQLLLIKKMTPIGIIQIVQDPVLSSPPFAVLIASCELGSPPYACTILDNLGINQNCEIAVQDKSWGAIKSLYNE